MRSQAKTATCKICEKRHGKEVKHLPCPICGEPLLATPISAVVDENGKLWSVPYFGGKCRRCGWIYGKYPKYASLLTGTETEEERKDIARAVQKEDHEALMIYGLRKTVHETVKKIESEDKRKRTMP